MHKIGLIVGSTRQGRFADHPAQWLMRHLARTDLSVVPLDLRDFPMPFFDEVAAPAYAPVQSIQARKWACSVALCDGYILVTPEYNRSIPGILKNALDYLSDEVARKPAAFVGYGGLGGAFAIQHLRTIAIELRMIPLRDAVHIGIEPYLSVRSGDAALDDFDHLCMSLQRMLEEICWWLHQPDKHQPNG
jgi:NAD(P)H-dependent FMN reductase